MCTNSIRTQFSSLHVALCHVTVPIAMNSGECCEARLFSEVNAAWLKSYHKRLCLIEQV